MKQSLPLQSLLILAASLYLVTVVFYATYHFQHGWSHAHYRRQRAANNAIKCREDAELMAGHYEQCMHDEADSQILSFWFAWRELSEHATFCPPVSCARALESFASSLGIMGFYVIMGGMVSLGVVYCAMTIVARIRPERHAERRWDEEDYGNPQIQYRDEDQPGVQAAQNGQQLRHRGPLVQEIP